MRLILVLPLVLFFLCACKQESENQKPNIIYILADDLGYGDISSCNPGAAWITEHIDRIASEGMSFREAHTGSAVCSPTR